MKFFIPEAKDDEQTKGIYKSIKDFAKKNLKWKIEKDKIYLIKYRHDGKEYIAKVGEHETFTNDLVLAILKSNAYLICTVNRGGLRDMPILVGYDEVINIEYFED